MGVIFMPKHIIWRITRHPQFVQSPISYHFLKVLLNDQTEPQLVPKLLLQVSVRELHNSLVSYPNDGGLKYARDEDGKIIISDSTLRSLLPPQLKQIPARYPHTDDIHSFIQNIILYCKNITKKTTKNMLS